MDPQTVLAAYDAQVRQHPDENGRVERDGAVVRVLEPGDGWAGVTWSDLDEARADATIAAQIERFAAVGRPWEWKYYSYDRPADLPDRLRAAGFTPEEPEALLVAEIAELALDVPPPSGITLQPVVDQAGVDRLVAVHDQVFGGDHAAVGRAVLAGLARQPATVAAVVALAGDTPVSAGRVEFHRGTEFASIWGGGTLPEWRGRGVFRSLVAHRAALAAARGFRYLQVDASPDSRPILQRLGFVHLATTTPYQYPGG
ncbi:MAG: GNAT family N-acetyltransferase [Actinobacteria bacterium 13_1_20CM_3_71_11]|nr:MAG: GNAT family N-acetyltransferase [Actinobacteria bacterium 13_1_20CM_3_71_11]